MSQSTSRERQPGEFSPTFADDLEQRAVIDRFHAEVDSGNVSDQTALELAELAVYRLGFSGPLIPAAIDAVVRGIPLYKQAVEKAKADKAATA